MTEEIVKICSACSKENAAYQNFCGACGAALDADPAISPEARKTITALFSDIKGSTALAERMDPESFRRVMARYFEEMKAVVENHGGTLEKFVGDAVKANFGVPDVREDDALRAIRAALEMRDALTKLNQELDRRWSVTLGSRTGINTGEVLVGGSIAGTSLLLGDAMNLAARLEEAAAEGEILIGQDTYRLVRDAVTVEALEPLVLKGKAEPTRAFRLLDVKPDATLLVRRLDSPLVGRQNEKRALERAFRMYTEGSDPTIVVIVGEPGIGKTRLALNLAEAVQQEATVLTGRCISYGDGITYLPITEMIREAAGIQDDDSAHDALEKIANFLGDTPEEVAMAESIGQVLGLVATRVSPSDVRKALKFFLAAGGRGRPLVVLLDDIHWAEPALLELIDEVAGSTRIMFVCMARPEFNEHAPAWPTSVSPLRIDLEPLGGDDTEHLIRNLLGRATTVDASDIGFTRAAEGNPLFLEQMISMLLDEGQLRLESGRWVPTTDLSGLPIPPTINALLTERVERLPPSEKAVLQCASVIGREFWQDALVDLCSPDLRMFVDVHLAALVNKSFIHPDPSASYQYGFAFRHVLVREAAYEQIPKERRSELHERVAEGIVDSAGERGAEQAEIIGYHFERAYRLREQLGVVDGRARGLADKAADHLIAAGGQATRRGDLEAADNLLSRAHDLLPAGSRERALLAIGNLALVRYQRGDREGVASLYLEFDEATADLGDERLNAHAHIGRVFLVAQVDPDAFTEGEGAADEAIPIFERYGDYDGLARAWMIKAWSSDNRLDERETERCFQKALMHARRSDVPWEWVFTGRMSHHLAFGPTPVDQAIPRCSELLLWTKGIADQEIFVLQALASLHAMAGAFEVTKEYLARTEMLAPRLPDYEGHIHAARAMILLGDLHGAADHVHRIAAYHAAHPDERRGPPLFVDSWLSDIYCRLQRYEEATRHARSALESRGWDEAIVQGRARAVLGRCLAAKGRFAPALAEVHRAVEQVAPLELPYVNGDIHWRLAETLLLARRFEEAEASLATALEFYAAKGDVTSATIARHSFDALAKPRLQRYT